MSKIAYVGKKPSKPDTVAGTGIFWRFPGDVQEVPEHAVAKLLNHPDVWALADAGDAQTTASQTVAENSATPQAPVKDPEKDHEDDSNKPPLVDLAAMDAKGLRDYAQQNFGHAFHPNTGEAKMRQTIIGLMNRG